MLLAVSTLLFQAIGKAAPLCLPPASNATGDLGLVQSSLTLEIDNWSTHKLITHAARILLHERLGLTVNLQQHTGGTGVYERAATGAVDANLEVWPLGKETYMAQWVCGADSCPHRRQ